MFGLMVAVVLVLVALACFGARGQAAAAARRPRVTTPDGKTVKQAPTASPGMLTAAGVGSLVAALAALAASCAYMVPTQQIGIPVTFGKPGAAQSNGFHLKAPWTHVVKMDGTVQIDDNLGDKRTEIRLGNQSVAYVQNSVRWHIKTDAADRLYRDHKNFDNIGIALEEPELSAALNEAFKDYNPLSAATGKEESLDQLAVSVQKRLTARIGDRLVIDSVIIPKVDFDAQTQARIDAYQQEIGNTRIAEQRQKTAKAEAEANRLLANSVSKDPNVLVNKCLDTLGEMVAKGQQVPVGFSCWPGSGTPVIADASTTAKPAK